MVKHNNVIGNGHFKKDWQQRVKTWFNQPAQKAQRRQKRVAKAKQAAPRPLGALRPAVRCQTIKYNRKVRAGRGFTIAELKEAGVNPSAAASLGVSIDRRRQNRSQESFNLNVQRLKEYKAKLVVFPRKAKVSKQGDSSAADLGSIGAQVSTAAAFPVQANEGKTKARVITKEEKAAKVSAVLRKERTDAQRWGARLKLAAAKAEAAKAGDKKAAKATKNDDDE